MGLNDLGRQRAISEIEKMSIKVPSNFGKAVFVSRSFNGLTILFEKGIIISHLKSGKQTDIEFEYVEKRNE